MSEVKKPFRRGKCQVCHSEEYLKAQKLCEKCQVYVDQDNESLEEMPLLLEPESVAYKKDDIRPLMLNGKEPLFAQIIRDANLTRQQRRIIKLHFVKEMTFEKISEKLRISKASVQIQVSRAIKKLKIRHTNSHIVRRKRGEDQNLTVLSGSKKPNAEKFKPEPKTIDPYHYYSQCPKCRSRDLFGRGNTGSCANCGWTFSVYSVAEVQNSHAWPPNPILDGSKY